MRVVIPALVQQLNAVTLRITSNGDPFGCALALNGQELADVVRSFTVTGNVDDVMRCHLEVFVKHGLDVTLPNIAVDLTAVVLPGYILIEETLSDGQRRWRAEREPAA